MSNMDINHILESLRWNCVLWLMNDLEFVPGAPGEMKKVKIDQVDFDDEVFQAKLEKLKELEAELDGCTRCRLHEGRTNLVFGVGNPDAKVVFVGEGPGYDEDMQGIPFVGQAGRLLTKMINALGWKREDVYICNVVKCRPPKNRTPRADEIKICSPFMFRQLEIIKPRVICLLGACAASTVLKLNMSMSRMRGKDFYWRGIPIVATYHPAYLLRNPAEKRKAWDDFKRLYRMVENSSSEISNAK